MFTFGILLLAWPSLPKMLVIELLAWAVISVTAAFALGGFIQDDLGLIVVAWMGVYLLLLSVLPAIHSLQVDDAGAPSS